MQRTICYHSSLASVCVMVKPNSHQENGVVEEVHCSSINSFITPDTFKSPLHSRLHSCMIMLYTCIKMSLKLSFTALSNVIYHLVSVKSYTGTWKICLFIHVIFSYIF